MANMSVQIISLTGAPPVSHFVKSRDYDTVMQQVEDGKKVVLVYGKSGQGKTQIGHQIMNQWHKEEDRRIFFFQTQTNDLYNASFSSILERNRWNQDSEWAVDLDYRETYDFLKLCKHISTKRSHNLEKILFHFDDLSDDKGQPTEETQKWITKLYKMIGEFSFYAPPAMQLLVTVPMRPKDDELSEGEHVYFHTMSGFEDSDIKQFFSRSLSHEPPDFLRDRVGDISAKMGKTPQLYKVKLERFQAMGSDERELDDFLDELDNLQANSMIKDRLVRLSYLPIWKVMTNFERINIPTELFHAVLIYCRETEMLGLSRTDNYNEIFSIMRSEYLRFNFVTEVREGHSTHQIDWTIHTEVYNCLEQLVKQESDDNKREYLTVGLMAMSTIIDRDDRFHSDKRLFPRRHINMLSQANALHLRITDDLMSSLSDYKKITVYQLMTGIYYAKLNKVGSDLDKQDLKTFYDSILELERLLEGGTVGNQSMDGTESLSFISDVQPETDTRGRYDVMRSYLTEQSDSECDIALRLYRFSQRDEEYFGKAWKERDDKIKKFRAKAGHFGMLTEEQLTKLREIHLILGCEAYREVYPLEVLASMYIILGKMRQHVNGIDGETAFWAKSPYDIYSFVTYEVFEVIENLTKKYFMQKVIIERDQVLQSKDNQMKFMEIKEKYERLKKLKEVYEYGFLRSNMEYDSYHHLNCAEGLLETLGNFMLDPSLDNQEISNFADEGIEICKKIKALVRKLFETTKNKHNSWRQYAYGMEYVARFLFKCGQSEWYRYYTYALFSFYQYADKTKEKIFTEKKFIKMCKEIIRLVEQPQNTLTGQAAEIVRERLCYLPAGICYIKPGGCDETCGICSQYGLKEKFLDELQGVETGLDEIKRGIDILSDKLTPQTDLTSPEDIHLQNV